MSLTNGNGNGKALEHIADSVWARILARWVAPVLLAGIGWFAMQMLNDIRGSAQDLSDSVEAINQQLSSTNRDIERLDGRLNVGDRVNLEQDRRLDNHDVRLEALSRRASTIVPVPR